MKALKALAIVKKKNPRIKLLDIYGNKDNPKVDKDEMIIAVHIVPEGSKLPKVKRNTRKC